MHIIAVLSNALDVVQSSHFPDPIITQLFKELFHHINAVLLNALFMRKEICTCSNGFQIKLEISEVETWVNQKGGTLIQRAK